MTPAQIQAADRTLTAGTWTITGGAILYSVLTVTPLVMRVTPEGWEWTAPILPVVVDAAVVITTRMDAVVARLGGRPGGWPTVLRWMTGLMTLLLNVGDSALKRDWVGVAVHSVAPILLIVTAEAALAYRRTIIQQLDRIEREQADERSREQADERVREQREREEREHAEDRERDRADSDRRARERAEREAREHTAQIAREEREAAERLERERLDRESEQAREDREHALRMAKLEDERRAQERREDREQRDRAAAKRAREAAEQRQRADREQPQPHPVNTSTPVMNTTATPVNTSGLTAATSVFTDSVNSAETQPMNTLKLPESEALTVLREHPGDSVRSLAGRTGWSIGWINARRKEMNELVSN
ncbi:DUF2637 domain-containing protein [Streptomyces sp. NPDC001889]